jgi:hypothetical protein
MAGGAARHGRPEQAQVAYILNDVCRITSDVGTLLFYCDDAMQSDRRDAPSRGQRSVVVLDQSKNHPLVR